MKNLNDKAQAIRDLIKNHRKADSILVKELLAKARELKGLSLEDSAVLLDLEEESLLEEMFRTAREVKESIYGNRMVIFAPLYVSNECTNGCLYCAFRQANKEVRRATLTQEQVAEEIRILLQTGQKRILLVAGEHPQKSGIEYLEESIKTIYKTTTDRAEIRRVNVNAAPMDVDDFRRLKAAKIGTYQCFQETYDPDVYRLMHPTGPKSDYEYRRRVMERAMKAGIDDVGIGALLGLGDYKFEVLAMLDHSKELDELFGAGPHTISVPRLEPATGTPLADNPPSLVNDLEFKKLVAVLRLAVPYTGIILSTRESAAIRREVFRLGVSQASAGSRTDVGGYKQGDPKDGQFYLGDHRPLDEIIRELLTDGYIPSFCTACYRMGRTGHDFMDLAKPGVIKNFCHPNALLTLKEYLQDFASTETRQLGNKVITDELEKIPSVQKREMMRERLAELEGGKRDLYF
jgi:2-iminoacetate synthase